MLSEGKMKYFFIILIFLSVFSSCVTQKVITPPDKPVMLATTDMKCVQVSEKRDWYFLWGLKPVNEKEVTTAPLLTDVNKPVKIEITTTALDAFMTIFTFWASFVPETTKVYECSK